MAFEQKSGTFEKDTDQLIEFIRMINQLPPKDFAERIEVELELDDFLRTTAVLLLARKSPKDCGKQRRCEPDDGFFFFPRLTFRCSSL